jgi:hypothetical protein
MTIGMTSVVPDNAFVVSNYILMVMPWGFETRHPHKGKVFGMETMTMT